MNNPDLNHIPELFNIDGAVLGVMPLGNGHINDTYLVTTEYSAVIRPLIRTSGTACP